MIKLTQQAPIRSIALALALTLGACATHQTTASGFLTSEAPAAPAVAAAYTAAIIEPVVFNPVGLTPKTIKPQDVAALKAAYQEELALAFGKRMTLTQIPGPGVLRVRAAITGYTLANPAWNAAAMLAPIGPRSGGVSTEAEMVDSLSGHRIAAEAQSFNGGLFNAAPTNLFKPKGHARKGFQAHAEALAAKAPL